MTSSASPTSTDTSRHEAVAGSDALGTPTRRPTRQQGYDNTPISQRALWAPIVRTGKVRCRTCHRYIESGTAWHLDHHDDPTIPAHPEHRACHTVSRQGWEW